MSKTLVHTNQVHCVDHYLYLVESPAQADQIFRCQAIAIQGNVLYKEMRLKQWSLDFSENG